MEGGDWRRAVDSLGQAQGGLVATRQLRSLGLSRSQQDRLLADGSLVRVRAGVLRCPGVALRWESAVIAAVLAAGEAVASHFTAAQLWDFVDRDRPSSRPGIHLTAPRRIGLAGVVSHRQALPASDVTLRRGVPVTSALRTIADIATDPSMGPDELGTIVDQALRRRLIRLSHLREVMVRCGGPGRPSMQTLRTVLAARGVGFEPGANDWERQMDQWWTAAGLPEARRQYRTRIDGRTYIIDRAIVDLRIAVEWNGFDSHGRYRSGFDATAVRQLALVGAGWAYIPVTARTPLDAVCRAVSAAVYERTPRDDTRHGPLPNGRQG